MKNAETFQSDHGLNCDQLVDIHHTQNSLEKNRKTEFLQKTKTLDMKIQVQISPITCPVLINRKHECKSYQPKQKMRRKLHRKVLVRIKE